MDVGRIARAAATWLDGHGRAVSFVGVLLLAPLFLFKCAHWSWPALSWSAVAARTIIVIASVPIAQGCVRGVSAWLKEPDAFHLPKIDDEPQNRRPQKVLGVVENLAYPWIMFALDPSASATAVGAWLVLKTLGDWKGWGDTSLEERKRIAPASNTPPNDDDPHEGRRRLYAFAVCNALQVFFGVAVAWVIGRVN